MSQLRDILRGCFATYLAGTFFFWIAEIPSSLGGASVFGVGETLVILAVYGAMFSVFATVITLAIWLLLAVNDATVPFPAVPFVGGVVFGGLGFILMGMIGLVFGFVLGAIAGVHFWYWAFGRDWDVQMQFRPR